MKTGISLLVSAILFSKCKADSTLPPSIGKFFYVDYAGQMEKHSIDVQIQSKDTTLQTYSMSLTTQEQAIGFFSPQCDGCELSGPTYDFA